MNWKIWGGGIFLLLCLWVGQQWPDGKLKTVFCDVGQGDAAIVILGKFEALIDTGPNENKLNKCLSDNIPFWDREIELVFVSHSDRDHSGQIENIKKVFKIGKIIDHPVSHDIVRYGKLQFEIVKGNEPVLSSVDKNSSESNESSVVMRMSYLDFSVLFTGDIDIPSELALIDMGALKNTQVLKVSHHGSKYGTSNEFLDVVKPKLAIVSVGAKNNYGHPNGDTLIRLGTVGAKVFRTDKIGTIILLSDGKTTQVFSRK